MATEPFTKIASGVTPPCPLFGVCGGCQLQHLTDQAYADSKEGTVRSAIEAAGFNPALTAPLLRLPVASRRRVEWACWRSPDGGKPALGFHRARSHEAVAVPHCLVLSPALAEASEAIQRRLEAFPSRLRLPEGLHLTLSETGIDALWLAPSQPNQATEQSLTETARVVGVARISLRYGKTITLLWQEGAVEVACGKVNVAIPPGLFLQASREGQEAITRTVLEVLTPHLTRKSSVVDLFAGIGTYSFPLAEYAKVHAVEGDETMTSLTQNAANRYGLSGRVSVETRDLNRFPLPPSELNRYNAAIVNPPRAGALAQCKQIAASKLSHVVMVSCNPQSFARDAALLRQGGFTLVRAVPIDQFVYANHVEAVAYFARKPC